jgi:hypothetical protein
VLCAGNAHPAGDGARQRGDTATDQAGQGTRGKVNKLSGYTVRHFEQIMIITTEITYSILRAYLECVHPQTKGGGTHSPGVREWGVPIRMTVLVVLNKIVKTFGKKSNLKFRLI